MSSYWSRRSLLAGTALLGLQILPRGASAQAKNTWTPAGSMNSPRDAFTICVVAGKIIALGGRTTARGSTVRTTESYSLANALFAADKSMNTDRSFFPVVPLKDSGKVLVVGGFSGRSGTIKDVEVFNTAAGDWSTVGSLNAARELLTATLLPDGQVLAAGGFSNGAILDSAELYNPGTEKFTYTGSMKVSRHGHTATLIPTMPVNALAGQVLVMGGRTSKDVSLDSTEVYDPSKAAWSAGPKLVQDRFRQTATVLQDGRILIIGGYSSVKSATLDTAEIYDPALNSFSLLTSKMVDGRMDHTATLLPDGRVLVAGGWSSAVKNTDGSLGSTVASVDIFDPAKSTFSAVAALPVSRHEHAAALITLADGMPAVLVAGGLHWEPALHQTLKDAWIYTP